MVQVGEYEVAEEAIPILEERLEIPDQEAAVREQLDAAIAEAG